MEGEKAQLFTFCKYLTVFYLILPLAAGQLALLNLIFLIVDIKNLAGKELLIGLPVL